MITMQMKKDRQRVLVTGAAGFIGSHLCEALVRDGHVVTGLDAYIPSYDRAVKEQNLAKLNGHERFTFVEADLRTDDLDRYTAEADAVINEAAMPGLTRSWTEMSLYASCNLIGLQRLLDACLRTGTKRVVHASTSSVYGRNAIGDESQPRRPVSPYGITKLAAEHLIEAYVEAYDLPAVVLRYFSIFGPRQRPDMAYAIFIDRLRAGKPITIYGDGEQSRSNTFVTDCVRGTTQALHGADLGDVYNIGGGATITLNEAVDVLANALHTTAQVVRAPRRIGDQLHTRADISKARKVFGYEPQVDPVHGLRVQAQHAVELATTPRAVGSELPARGSR
jgi:nucleoside-diphosphate-sugar epimerase